MIGAGVNGECQKASLDSLLCLISTRHQVDSLQSRIVLQWATLGSLHGNLESFVPEFQGCTVIICEFLQEALVHISITSAWVSDSASLDSEIKRKCVDESI